MRPIEFRGVNKETGEFVYGWYTKLQEGARIFDAIIAKVDDEFTRFYIHDAKTIGEFTGENDFFENKIFEGDIVFIDSRMATGVVVMDVLAWKIKTADDLLWLCDFYDTAHVVGNIHQNPELLEQ